MNKYTKINENTIGIEKTVNETYDYQSLLDQKSHFASMLVNLQTKIADLDATIAQADKLGIKPVVVVIEPPIIQ